MKSVPINERMQQIFDFTHVGVETRYKFQFAKEFTKIFANHDSKNEMEVVTGDVVLDKKVMVNCRNYWLAEGVYLSIDNENTSNLNMLVVDSLSIINCEIEQIAWDRIGALEFHDKYRTIDETKYSKKTISIDFREELLYNCYTRIRKEIGANARTPFVVQVLLKYLLQNKISGSNEKNKDSPEKKGKMFLSVDNLDQIEKIYHEILNLYRKNDAQKLKQIRTILEMQQEEI